VRGVEAFGGISKGVGERSLVFLLVGPWLETPEWPWCVVARLVCPFVRHVLGNVARASFLGCKRCKA